MKDSRNANFLTFCSFPVQLTAESAQSTINKVWIQFICNRSLCLQYPMTSDMDKVLTEPPTNKANWGQISTVRFLFFNIFSYKTCTCCREFSVLQGIMIWFLEQKIFFFFSKFWHWRAKSAEWKINSLVYQHFFFQILHENSPCNAKIRKIKN